MKVRVHYWSSQTQDFVVNEDMLFAEFTKMAFELGGKIKHVEYL